uniref:DUF3179 domain-containing protein n=1 Tax=Solibacter usitatus (strain Ellin6076) TaxID=234267 RepID=Q02BW2_SOLUE
MAGLRLTFHLAAINNQNFLMRDEETGSYWQQISGAAISGPLKGSQLTLVHSDELTLATWKSEQPEGKVLDDVREFTGEYAKRDWDVRMKRAPTVLNFPEHALAARDLMLGIQAFGASRAFPYERVIQEKLVKDHVGSEPVLLVVGADNQSVRAFRAKGGDFYRITGRPGVVLMDAATGSEWNFQGCATSGKAAGQCLEPVPMLKDYWFDWRNYNPKTTVYGKGN